jgi:hypothetical protein
MSSYTPHREVPDGYMHVYTTYDQQSKQELFSGVKTGSYSTSDVDGSLSGILPTTPYVIAEYNQIKLKNANTNHRDLIVTYIYRIKQQIVDPERYFTYPQCMSYDDSNIDEHMLSADDYIRCLLARAIYQKIKDIDPDQLLILFGSEHYAIVDQDFKEFINEASLHGLEISELSFMLLDIDDVTDRRRNW